MLTNLTLGNIGVIKERFCGGAERQGGCSLLAKCLPSKPLTTTTAGLHSRHAENQLVDKVGGCKARQGPIKKCTEGWCHMASAAGSEIALQGVDGAYQMAFGARSETKEGCVKLRSF